MKNTIARFAGRGAVLTMVVGTALGAAVAGSAAADIPGGDSSPGEFVLCSRGGYDSYATFPGRGGLSTAVVPRGHCETVSLTGKSPEPVRFFVSPGGKFIAATSYDPRTGLDVSTVKGPDIRF
ncbi:hypothetical protein [Amycolatopsis sp. PS_44_ISF1]|uniref:hypothetical protein n=1 Tax=Amycolatopsis sp. PS_44_ISF1 TaxID=2974917 RepID=UPI0028DDE100|nr:hypothetical protein [Amycolatopsis sp. PS_44_ISF1]MDT8911657.1 hypothetical protein [Amycolatopsis sp. PS_44_ISF1]